MNDIKGIIKDVEKSSLVSYKKGYQDNRARRME